MRRHVYASSEADRGVLMRHNGGVDGAVTIGIRALQVGGFENDFLQYI
jgi:hypothetical protein